MPNRMDSAAMVVLPTDDLNADMEFFYSLGFRLEQIYPADDPAVAILSGHNLCIRLDRDLDLNPALIHLQSDQPELIGDGRLVYIAPNGTPIHVVAKSQTWETPPAQHKFEVRQLRDGEPWVIGRAGMLYRDLIPDRLGGSIIASHIRIPNGGPVPDMVHYHTIGFQLIYCYKGWVKLVYEDQGPPFILNAGDCVTQPPEIRHQVLESSDNLEVIEIGVPAVHLTTIDHDMVLPNETVRPDREFMGQKFCHHLHENAVWENWRIEGFECYDTGVNQASNGVASVIVVRPLQKDVAHQWIAQDADILFSFVMNGQFELMADGHETRLLKARDAYVIPPELRYQLQSPSDDLEILEVALPGEFKTSYF
ncbi:MAG: cupin domain-containing protein [Bacteroidota bacterium]